LGFILTILRFALNGESQLVAMPKPDPRLNLGHSSCMTNGNYSFGWVVFLASATSLKTKTAKRKLAAQEYGTLSFILA